MIEGNSSSDTDGHGVLLGGQTERVRAGGAQEAAVGQHGACADDHALHPLHARVDLRVVDQLRWCVEARPGTRVERRGQLGRHALAAVAGRIARDDDAEAVRLDGRLQCVVRE